MSNKVTYDIDHLTLSEALTLIKALLNGLHAMRIYWMPNDHHRLMDSDHDLNLAWAAVMQKPYMDSRLVQRGLDVLTGESETVVQLHPEYVNREKLVAALRKLNGYNTLGENDEQ